MATAEGRGADVCLLLEGTYPYVAGGVSSWVHEIVRGHPELRFSLVHIGVQPEVELRPCYPVPDNVIELRRLHCQDAPQRLPRGAARAALEQQIERLRRRASAGGGRPRMLEALARLHLAADVDDGIAGDLAAGDLSVAELLHGGDSFALVGALAERLAPEASFLDFFWHFRAMHVPLWRLITAELPPARVYHSVTTGYAGALGAVASVQARRPLLITEHGLYAREREIELARADPAFDPIASAPMRRFWLRFFRRLSVLAYRQASQIVTLSEVNRRKQLSDGAPAGRARIIPNGVDVERLGRIGAARRPRQGALRVGFVGRVVAIKDVLGFIRACDRALASVPLEARIIGPSDEEPAYADRCRALCAQLGRQDEIRFVGPQPLERIYGELDVVVLTSVSEAQPLVVLEAFAAGLPVVASDVGCCRELLEGRAGVDRQLGAAGVVTRPGRPDQTATALVLLARRPDLAATMGRAGQRRAARFYRRSDMLDSYRALYGAWVMS